MGYASRVAVNDPIGSGVAEAACKMIMKRETVAVWFGDAVEGDRGGGRPEPEVSELHPGALGPILVQGGSVWISGSRVA
jgi:hypothetical protein